MFAFIDGPYPFSTVLLFSLLFGVGAGLLYECFRILRVAGGILFPHKGKLGRILHTVSVCFQDLFYFGILTVAAVLFFFVCNRGQVRLSLLCAMLLGFVLYLLTLGRLLLRLHRAILRFMYRVLRFTYFHTLHYLFVFLGFLYRKTLYRILCRMHLRWKALCLKMMIKHRRRKLDALLEEAKNGFAGSGEHISIS